MQSLRIAWMQLTGAGGSVLTVDIDRRVDDLDTGVGEAQALHRGAAGYFAIFRKSDPTKGGPPSQRMYSVESLPQVVSAMRSAPDTYLSQASFVRRSRRMAYLSSIGTAYVDLDCYKMGIVPDEQFVEDLLGLARDAGLPNPSYVTFSGRGLYLKWLFSEPLPASQLPMWESLQNVLIPLYRSLGADIAVKDVSRVLRILGTTNSANGAEVRHLWRSGARHDFADLCQAIGELSVEDVLRIGREGAQLICAGTGQTLLEADEAHQNRVRAARQLSVQQAKLNALRCPDPDSPAWRERQAAAMLHLQNFSDRHEPLMLEPFSLRSLAWKRFCDLRDLAIRRGGIPRGTRDLHLFWMGVFLGQAGAVRADRFEHAVADLLGAFVGDDFDPIKDQCLSTLLNRLEMHEQGKAQRFCGQMCRPLYTPSNEYLIGLFDIDEDEQMGLSTIISTTEKRRRVDDKVPGRAKRREERLAWREKALDLAGLAPPRSRPPEAMALDTPLRSSDREEPLGVNAIARAVGVSASAVSRFLSRTRTRRAIQAAQAAARQAELRQGPATGAPLNQVELQHRRPPTAASEELRAQTGLTAIHLEPHVSASTLDARTQTECDPCVAGFALTRMIAPAVVPRQQLAERAQRAHDLQTPCNGAANHLPLKAGEIPGATPGAITAAQAKRPPSEDRRANGEVAFVAGLGVGWSSGLESDDEAIGAGGIELAPQPATTTATATTTAVCADSAGSKRGSERGHEHSAARGGERRVLSAEEEAALYEQIDPRIRRLMIRKPLPPHEGWKLGDPITALSSGAGVVPGPARNWASQIQQAQARLRTGLPSLRCTRSEPTEDIAPPLARPINEFSVLHTPTQALASTEEAARLSSAPSRSVAATTQVAMEEVAEQAPAQAPEQALVSASTPSDCRRPAQVARPAPTKWPTNGISLRSPVTSLSACSADSGRSTLVATPPEFCEAQASVHSQLQSKTSEGAIEQPGPSRDGGVTPATASGPFTSIETELRAFVGQARAARESRREQSLTEERDQRNAAMRSALDRLKAAMRRVDDQDATRGNAIPVHPSSGSEPPNEDGLGPDAQCRARPSVGGG